MRGFLFLLPILGFCQELIVSEIIYRGNSFTKDYIISREIQHPLDVPLDSTVAIADRNRLLNLGIFADVNWRAIPLDNKNVRLEYEILENNKFYGGRFIGGPVPSYEEKTGWSYGGGGMFKNFRGRNEMLGMGLMLGGRTTFGVSYLNPWITGDHVSLKADIAKVMFRHPFLPYDVDLKTIEFNMGRFFGYEKKASLGFEIEAMDFKNDSIKFSYHYFAPMGSFHYDTRDLYANPTKGVLFKQAFVSRFDLNGEIENNFIWFQSYSFYKRLSHIEDAKPWILAWGIKAQINYGTKDQNFLTSMGNSGSVRGWQYPNYTNYNDSEQEYRFGFHNLKTAIELRKVIIPRLPLANLYEFGLTVGAFIDLGVTTKNDFKNLLNLKPISGSGITFQFQAPFVEILRIDYGWGFYNGKQVDRGLHIATQHQI
ncbi:MAG: BamA/TamA family outer membrane protein [Candidatus Marinimicrobia bacterium]|nr:BamA/TamA family outer membrane protein [Candidatus Neomarinimicrobiota bacterium]MBT6841297.1 BamA/TamA family outer membrane protein [Candidatus Neomarinimicrobiota bacterium]